MSIKKTQKLSINKKLFIIVLSIYCAFAITSLILQLTIKQSNLTLIATTIINILALSITLWIAGYKLIRKPLASLVYAIREINSSNLSSRKIILNPNNKKTELDTLANSFNVMIHRLYKTQNNLIDTQNRLSGIINAMPSVIIGITKEGVITDWNTHAVRATGLNVDEVKGEELAVVRPSYKGYLALAKEAMTQNIIQKQTKHVELIDQERRYFDVIAYPVINDDYIGAVIRIDDVTTQVKFEEIMAQTEKMSSIGGLAAGVAHEINNPLGAIMQGVQNVLRRLDPTSAKNKETAESLNINIIHIRNYLEKRSILEFLDGIYKSGERATNIVRNLLQFTRFASPRKTMNKMENIIEKAIALASADYDIKKKVDFRHIKIIKDYEPDLPKIYCCAIEIEQVILNLLKNAAHATTKVARSPEVYIRLFMDDNRLIIEVEDNGSGMPESIRKRIFEPFFTTKSVGEGTGLGLSVSYNIVVERHNGSLTVESVEGVGTRFTILLPNVQVETTTEEVMVSKDLTDTLECV